MESILKLLLSLFILSISLNAYSKDNVYQIYEAKDGRVLRLNLQTGDVHLVAKEGLVSLSDKSQILKVGSYYEMDDGPKEAKYLKYLGGGKFEKSQFAILSIK
jgi:hypothetical protein